MTLSFFMFSDKYLIQKVNVKLLKLIYFFMDFEKYLHQQKIFDNEN